MGLSEAELSDLYYTLLLKDLGCSSNAARLCRLYLTDDLKLKRDFKTVDGSLPQILRFVLTHTGMKAGLAERFRAMLNILQNAGEFTRELMETRCQRGAEIARQMRFSESVAQGILNLDEHWDGGGQPEARKGIAIPVFSGIALMAQVIDVFQISSGRDAARREIRNRAGGWFDPRLVEAFERVAERVEFWTGLASPELEKTVFELDPAQDVRIVDEDYLDEIAAAFAKVVDSKSPFTHGHSERVALFTDMIAEQMGYDAAGRRWLKRAALLHDIGKLGVSNTILDKPGKPDAEEWEAIRMHPVHSETILLRISAFAEMAPIASAHHERLDGKGYPKGLTAADLCLETRILTTADIFDALTAERPYRGALPVSKALAIMTESLDTAIDPVCFEALRQALGRLDTTEAVKAA